MSTPGQDALLLAIDAIADLVILGDADGCVVYRNRHATALLGAPAESSSIWCAFPDHLRGRVELACQRARRDQRAVEITEHVNAQVGWYTLRVQPHADHLLLTGSCVTALVVREQLGELESRLTAHGPKLLRPHELLERAAAEFRAMAGWDVGEAWMLHERREWRRTAAWTSGRPGVDQFVNASETLSFALDVGLPGLAAHAGAPVYLEDIQASRAFKRKDAAATAGLQSALAIPVMTDGGPYGILLFAHSSSLTHDVWRPLIEAFQSRLAEMVARARETDAVGHLFELSLDGMVIAGTDEYFHRINNAFCRMLGRSQEDILAKPWSYWIHPDDQAPTLAELARLKSGLPTSVGFQNRYRHADGSWRYLSWVVYPDTYEGQVYGTVRDVTERRALEEQLRESQKMEAIGRLAGGIAHDFNNMLTAISGFAELVMVDLDESAADARLHVAEIQRAATRSAELTHKLLAFSRRQILQPRTVDISDVVRGISQLLGRLLGESIRQRIELAEQPVLAKVDSGQIEQVVLNLVINAKEAMRGGGALRIETAIVALSAAAAAAHVGVVPGLYAMVAVHDTGHGMTDEVRERIFEPFFTTKGDGGGTGLGLSTVIGIVSQSGGHIAVESAPNVGTSMRVYFPLVTQAVPAVPVPTPAPASAPARAGTILVVEDEELLRSLVRRILERAGFTVMAAVDGEEALALVAAHTGPLDLVLTDVVLPGVNGKVVAEGITALRPGTPVLFMSGYTEDAIVHHGVLDEGIEFLEKPFTRQDLLGRIGTILGHTA